MTPIVLAALIVGAPIVLLTTLRVNAAIIFLSLCLGSVLVNFVGQDASIMSMFVSTHVAVNTYTMSLALLLIPPILTTIIMIRSVKGAFATLLNILPAAAVGVVGLLLALPLMSAGMRHAIESTPFWKQIQQGESFIVVVSTLSSLAFLWMQRPKHKSEDSSKHHG